VLYWATKEIATMALTTQPPAAPAAPAARDPDVPTVPIYRLTVAQYHAMAEAGILGENDPVELLEGWLVKKMTKHRPHSRSTLRTRRALERLLSGGWYVDTQEPITTLDSEPEPDVVVIRGEEQDYPDRHPEPNDVGILVEVADSSLQYDRGTKKRIYARAGIRVYWIVNLIERQIEVYTDPTGPADEPDYRQQQVYAVSDTLPVGLDGVEVGRLAVQDLLP
jgi:Uma2 family endonuclease